ncbi:hypothetical protein Vi05172_g12309 [Venturia inaequalis]|nr:hypothetical protein Vi05172_g12309 [Venturia inaequalis]
MGRILGNLKNGFDGVINQPVKRPCVIAFSLPVTAYGLTLAFSPVALSQTPFHDRFPIIGDLGSILELLTMQRILTKGAIARGIMAARPELVVNKFSFRHHQGFST